MIQAVIFVVALFFILMAVMSFAGPLFEHLNETIGNADAVQTMGHAGIIDSIQQTVLEFVPVVLVIGFPIIYIVAWMLRREKFVGGRR